MNPVWEWVPTTAEQYDAMLNVLPPAFWVGGTFLVGESVDDCPVTGAPRFEAYRQRGDVFSRSSRAVTVAEIRLFLRECL